MKKFIISILFVFGSLFLATSVFAEHNGKGEHNVLETAMQTSDLSTFVTAVKAADLQDSLKGHGPYTIFAPTNEAFAKLPKETLDALLKDKTKLTAILTYHIVSGEVMAKDIQPGTVKTLEGQDITIAKDGNSVMVNNAQVTKADIKASNGVIHEINTVLLPPSN